MTLYLPGTTVRTMHKGKEVNATVICKDPIHGRKKLKGYGVLVVENGKGQMLVKQEDELSAA